MTEETAEGQGTMLIQVRVPEPLAHEFKVICAKERTNMSAVLRGYMEKVVAKQKEGK